MTEKPLAEQTALITGGATGIDRNVHLEGISIYAR